MLVIVVLDYRNLDYLGIIQIQIRHLHDVTHEKMMEFEPLLEASGERTLRSINLTPGECPCHCLAQTVWYPEHSNLCLIWDVEEILSIGLPGHQQEVALFVVSTMLALRWIEENSTKN